jgi:hypothetical protein
VARTHAFISNNAAIDSEFTLRTAAVSASGVQNILTSTREIKPEMRGAIRISQKSNFVTRSCDAKHHDEPNFNASTGVTACGTA